MKQANNSERQALWETLLLRGSRGKLRHGDRKIVAEQFKISRWVVSRVWKRGIRSMGERVAAVVASRASQRGRKKKDRAEICKRIHQTRVADRNNYRTIEEGAGLTRYMIRQLQREDYLRRSLTQTRPLLTEKHKTDRLKWCLLHVTQSTDRQPDYAPMYDTVHVDEKWFYVKKIGQMVYLLTGQDGTPCEDAPVQFVQSKRHILKEMFLCAVARPRGNWDGKVGMWPVVEKYVTQRRSVNRDAGVEELRPISMTREVHRRMLLEDVIPAIKAKWEWVRDEGLGVPLVSPIWVQQDNAKPHVLPDDPEVLVAGCAGGWSILFRNQPAQSPDLNVLDCGFFNAIQSLQSVTVPRTAEDLISEVEMAFASTTTTTLNKTFLSVQLIMQSIMRHNGGNAFGLSHIQKGKLLRAGELPDSLSCDPALYRATLAKFVPQRATTCAPPPSSDFDAFF